MAAFASIGETLENGVAGYGEQISGALITSLGPVIYIGVSLYFLMRGYLIMSGRSQGALGDLAKQRQLCFLRPRLSQRCGRSAHVLASGRPVHGMGGSG